ncbi:MAG: hypothetical protein ABIA97_04190 [Candidatus Omnitrophota bacterium]
MIRKILHSKKANSTIEFSFLTVVMILAFISMQAYFKRGIAGGLRRQIDQMAAQHSYEHGSYRTISIESTNSNETERKGFTYSNITQNLLRITDEEIEPMDAESQKIRI